ncbi:MAG: hypothetical protein KAQ83_01075 [Nanoarchaeota archaeon]|nr:hypothetical protein [Nanoarchaeota archaeon]
MVNIKSKLEEGWIQVAFIVEMMGKPQEHLEKTLKEYVDNLKKDKHIEFINEDYAESEPVEDSTMFSTFVELEVLMKDPKKIMDFCFDFMPSSVEIIEPTTLHIKNEDLNSLFNDLQARLHKVDMVAKNANQQNKILSKNGAILVFNSILLALKQGPVTLDELHKLTRVPESELPKFLEKMVADKKVKLANKKYSLI